MKTTFTMLVHGESKVGKSRLGSTCPGPVLILDAEGRAKYLPGRKVLWDPLKSGPPEADGTWDICIVMVTSFQVVQLVYDWLQSGQHPFLSVVLDSIMEIQKRCKDQIAGSEQMKTQNWEELLRRLDSLVRSYRDLCLIESNTLAIVIFIAGSIIEEGQTKLLIQGSLKNTLPFIMDTTGYFFNEATPEGGVARKLLTQKLPGYIAGDGTDRLPAMILSPNITDMYRLLQQEEAA